jgi:hypothetical protein
MSLGELLRTKSSEYELLAEWHAERAPLETSTSLPARRWPLWGSCSRRLPRRLSWSGGRRRTRTELFAARTSVRLKPRVDKQDVRAQRRY